MKIGTIILVLIIACASIFAFLTVNFTNHNLEGTFRTSSQNAFHLISYVVDHYLEHTKQTDEARVERLRNLVTGQPDIGRSLTTLEENADLQGIWVIENSSVMGTTEFETMEDEILDFYRRSLMGNNEHTLVMFGGKQFFLINTANDSGDILILADAATNEGTRIEAVLDSLVASSNLMYFAIMDENNTPVIFSTLYENFLPLQGSGQHLIDTPEGRVLQIEDAIEGNSIIAGFAMDSLDRMIRRNNTFLAILIVAFAILEGALFAGYWKFERFRFKKEREINRFKEVGALATGFAHEFRNSLHTLTLMARSLDKESSSILLDETSRMKTIMDSLRLLSTSHIDHKEIKATDLISESMSMLDSIIKGRNVAVSHNVNEDMTIRGNRALLVTAISNMIRNSIEAEAKHIEISACRKGQKVKIEVTDDGAGIEESVAGQVFDPFFSKKGQSGIGLYLTRRIIELHGGRIEMIRNEKTVFIITLPR